MKTFIIGLFSLIVLGLAVPGVAWAQPCKVGNVFGNAVVVIGIQKNARAVTFLCDGGYTPNDQAKPKKRSNLPPGVEPSVSATVTITKYKKPGASDPCIVLSSPWGGSQIFCWGE